MGNYSGKLQQLLCLLICVLMVVAVSIRRDGKVTGRYVNQQQTVAPKTEPMTVLEDGSVRLNTTELGKDIVGYGGTVPLEESGRRVWCDVLIKGYHQKRAARTSVCSQESSKDFSMVRV